MVKKKVKVKSNHLHSMIKKIMSHMVLGNGDRTQKCLHSATSWTTIVPYILNSLSSFQKENYLSIMHLNYL